MGAVLHRLEADAGERRFVLTFRLDGGEELEVVAQVEAGAVAVAESALPTGWDAGTEAHAAALRAVLAMYHARQAQRPVGTIVDVDGGWDVSLGNIALGETGAPECVAHGLMLDEGDGTWSCAVCGARAALT